MDLPVPRLTYEDLRAQADALLTRHHTAQQIPVPIEQILEFGFNVTIIPLPGLMERHEMDAFTSKGCRTVYVDHAVLGHRSANRYRFSLAHELGNIVLHREVMESIPFSDAQEWKRALRAIPEKDRGWLEWQAYSFAGLVLVPHDALKARLASAIRKARRAGFPLKDSEDVSKDYVSTWLGKQFEVSSGVIQKRLELDHLWPPEAS